MSTEIKLVDAKIAGKKVVVFSKTFCKFSKKAKEALAEYGLSPDDYEIVELDKLEEKYDTDAIQDYLKEKTGGRSVPRVFIDQKFIGGGDDTVKKHENGELKKLLGL